MNKRFFLSGFCAFVFIFAFEWIFHGIILGETYRQTAHLWRPESEMKQYASWMILGQFLFAYAFAFIFTKGYENKGLMEGVRYGLLISALYVPTTLIEYSVIPYPASLIITWIIGCVIELVLAGIILAVVYKKK